MTEYVAAIFEPRGKQRFGRFDDHSGMQAVVAKRAVEELHIQRGASARIARLVWDFPSRDFIVDEMNVRAVSRTEYDARLSSCRIIGSDVLYDASDDSFFVRCEWMEEADRHGQA